MEAGLLIFFACSGPGGGAAIHHNILTGYACAAFGGLVTLGLAYRCVRTRRVGLSFSAAVLLMLAHPAWTLSAIHGDCGFLKRDASYLFAAIFTVLLVRLCVALRSENDRPPDRRSTLRNE